MATGFTARGAYATGSNAISAAAQTDILANIDLLKALIIDGVTNPSGVKTPEFDRMHPALALQLQTEIDALKTAIDATATS
jgi:hypothetical protein